MGLKGGGEEEEGVAEEVEEIGIETKVNCDIIQLYWWNIILNFGGSSSIN